jgi:hypothetical protein
VRNETHQWSCDGQHFADDDALARHLVGCIDAGEVPVSFSRSGCWFRLGFEDEAGDPSSRSRVYTVTLVTNSPQCAGGNVFTATWPNGYVSEPVGVAVEDAPDAKASGDRTMHDISRVLSSIGTVLWPELYSA